MAKHSFERARWNRREARKRYREGFPRPSWRYFLFHWTEKPDEKIILSRLRHDLDHSVHGGLSRYTRLYRRRWRYATHEVCRLHRLGIESADILDPQPRRLGVMHDIW